MNEREQLKQDLSESVIEVFSSLFSLVPKISETSSADFRPNKGRDIISSIGFTGSIEGSLVAIFSEESACLSVSKMLETELKEVNKDVFDGIGELANMFSGCFKNRFSKPGIHFEITVPSVVWIDNVIQVAALDDLSNIQLFVDSGDIKFVLVFTYTSKGPGRILKTGLSEEKEQIAEKFLKDLIK